ncbi:MAG: ABC transporter ATP-binding protein [Candidatus Kapabacteria bacterium]|nr:ABC transporter ATP-binding protein [Candidatus Kapabacteria bacterium]
MADKLFEIQNLKTYFNIEGKWAKAVDGVSFDIYQGEVLGIVGESGSGKSVTSLSLMKLIPEPPGRIMEGSKVIYKGDDARKVAEQIKYDMAAFDRDGGINIIALDYEQMYKIRGSKIAMIFQEPMTSLNPVFRIGMQIAEVVMAHEGLNEKDALARAVEMLRLVGIPDPEKRIHDYPHQFSGGMRQRVMIAIALACNPAMLIADEPTTALDVTIQAQILELMLTLKQKRKEAAILLITHDLAVVAELCHRVIVMYGGKIQEIAEIRELFKHPMHPYTVGLMGSIPRPEDESKRHEPLQAIPGNVPSIMNLPVGCKFCTRCEKKIEKCDTVEPPLIEMKPNHFVRCHVVQPEMEGGRRYE